MLLIVAGEFKSKTGLAPIDFLYDRIASFTAKNTEVASSRGGSPTVFNKEGKPHLNFFGDFR